MLGRGYAHARTLRGGRAHAPTRTRQRARANAHAPTRTRASTCGGRVAFSQSRGEFANEKTHLERVAFSAEHPVTGQEKNLTESDSACTWDRDLSSIADVSSRGACDAE
eukprot:3386150-Pleurochrysis_carterae.AAC.1